jgi:hypothetical protein
VLLSGVAAQRRPLDVARFSSSCPARFRRTWTLSPHGSPSTGAGAVHAPECEQRQLFFHFNTRICVTRSFAQRCSSYPQSVHPHIPLLAPRYPGGLPLGLNVPRVIGIAADASRCARDRIRQGCFGRLEPGRGSRHPSRSWVVIDPCETCKGGCVSSRPHFFGRSPPKTKDRARAICVRDAGYLVIRWSCIFWCYFCRVSFSTPLNWIFLVLLSFSPSICLPRTVLLPTAWPVCMYVIITDAHFRRIKGSLHPSVFPIPSFGTAHSHRSIDRLLSSGP